MHIGKTENTNFIVFSLIPPGFEQYKCQTTCAGLVQNRYHLIWDSYICFLWFTLWISLNISIAHTHEYFGQNTRLVWEILSNNLVCLISNYFKIFRYFDMCKIVFHQRYHEKQWFATPPFSMFFSIENIVHWK
jgi:hypothetical protein